MKTPQIIVVVVVLALVVGGFVVFSKTAPEGPGPLDTFTQCLKDKGAIFYGAFWCPHCQDQKKLFGSSAKLIPYIECSTPNGQAQTQICIDKGIKSYPTWVFPDGSEQTGNVPLKMLADKTGCELPSNSASGAAGPSPSVASPVASSSPQ